MVADSLKKENYSSTYLSQLKLLATSFLENPPTSPRLNAKNIEAYLLSSTQLCRRVVSGEFDHITWNLPTERRHEGYRPRPRSKSKKVGVEQVVDERVSGLIYSKEKSIVNLVNRIEDNLSFVSDYRRLPKLIWLLKVIFELREDHERAARCYISNIRPTTLRKYDALWSKLKSSFNVEITTST